jgi:hypothetical protein
VQVFYARGLLAGHMPIFPRNAERTEVTHSIARRVRNVHPARPEPCCAGPPAPRIAAAPSSVGSRSHAIAYDDDDDADHSRGARTSAPSRLCGNRYPPYFHDGFIISCRHVTTWMCRWSCLRPTRVPGCGFIDDDDEHKLTPLATTALRLPR